MSDPYRDICAIIFDLDGTLYCSPSFAAAIQETAANYIAAIKAIELDKACRLMDEARRHLTQARGETPTLSAVCCDLGGNIRDLHAHFEACLQPEAHLAKDQRVIDLMERVAKNRQLFLFTNNNRALTTRIIAHLGINNFFQHVYAIDDTWKAKPDESMLDLILADAGVLPFQALFVGDRYDVDLRLPEQRGCPVYLSQSIEQLLQLGKLLNN